MGGYWYAKNSSSGIRTGFLVAVSSTYHDSQISHIYGVTNWHNVLKNGFSVVRINTIDGKTDILPFEPTEWEWIPRKDDIAAIELSVSKAHNVHYISTNAFATQQIITEKEIGIGDDVFMVGRFIDYDGGPTNSPAVRFGNISVTRIIQCATMARDASGGRFHPDNWR